MQNGDAQHFINEAFKHFKAIGAINAGVDLLVKSQLQRVMLADETSSKLESELGVVTVRNVPNLTAFCQAFIQAIAEHRHWGRQPTKQLVPA